MTWTEFGDELWKRIYDGPHKTDQEVCSWAVEQYRKLQRYNEELRAGVCRVCDAEEKRLLDKLAEARRLAEEMQEDMHRAGMPTLALPWKGE